MFSGNKFLTTIPAINISNGTSFSGMFFGCTALRTINIQLSFIGVLKNPTGGSTTMYYGIFHYCDNLVNVKFVENSIPVVGYRGSYKGTFDIHYSPYLTNESADSIIKGLCLNNTGYTLILRLHSDVIDKLTDEQVLEIANKKWVLG